MLGSDKLKVSDVKCVFIANLSKSISDSTYVIEHRYISEESELEKLYLYIKQVICMCRDIGFIEEGYAEKKLDELAVMSLRIHDYRDFVYQLIDEITI